MLLRHLQNNVCQKCRGIKKTLIDINVTSIFSTIVNISPIKMSITFFIHKVRPPKEILTYIAATIRQLKFT